MIFHSIFRVNLSSSFLSLAYRWGSPSQTSSWLSPSRLRAEVGSFYDLGDGQQCIRRGGSTRSLQLDYGVTAGCGGDAGFERGQETRRRTFQWERNQSGEWEKREREEARRHDGERKSRGDRSTNAAARRDSRDGSSSPVYEEYQEPGRDPQRSPDAESLYDTLPPTRRAYQGYPPSPPGLNLHPARLLPPLRAWDLQTGVWRGSEAEEDHGDELERLLNLVSLRARRASRANRSSAGSEPTAGRDGVK